MKKLLQFFILSPFFLFLSTPVIAFEARVVHVADGDTITIEPIEGGKRERVRLHGIDAPETNQPYGQAAKAYVTNAVLFKVVDVQATPQGRDRYGRIIAVIAIPDVGSLQEMLLSEGLAWVWPRYCRDCDDWKAIQGKAKRQQKGLWADGNPVEPWEWRRRR